MTITLPDALRPLLERQAQQAGLGSIDAYVLQVLLQADPGDLQPVDLDAWLRGGLAGPDGQLHLVPAEEVARRQREIEEALLHGLASGAPQEAGEEFWAERQRVLAERMAHRQQSSQS